MSLLDQNLFTLNITPSAENPNVIDLIDPSGTVHYRKERVFENQTYAFHVYDPISESVLATVSAPGATSKAKTIELHNPSVPVELKFTGTLTFRWSFKWESHEFDWKREECYMIRKPDPPVLVAITKEPPGRIKTSTVQILDYNLNRFDIEDRKGLEIVLLSALLSFQDQSAEIHTPRNERPDNSSSSRQASATSNGSSINNVPPPPPPPVPKPKPKNGVEAVAALQKGDLNEVTVEADGSYKDYAQLCANLLEANNMLFVVARSSSAATVPKVLQVVEQAKRIRHKAGAEDELYSYVQYDTDAPSSSKGPRRINLDDDDGKGKKKYKPPSSLTVHLSKIPMPELEPKAAAKPEQQPTQAGASVSRRPPAPATDPSENEIDPGGSLNAESSFGTIDSSNRPGTLKTRSMSVLQARKSRRSRAPEWKPPEPEPLSIPPPTSPSYPTVHMVASPVPAAPPKRYSSFIELDASPTYLNSPTIYSAPGDLGSAPPLHPQSRLKSNILPYRPSPNNDLIGYFPQMTRNTHEPPPPSLASLSRLDTDQYVPAAPAPAPPPSRKASFLGKLRR